MEHWYLLVNNLDTREHFVKCICGWNLKKMHEGIGQCNPPGEYIGRIHNGKSSWNLPGELCKLTNVHGRFEHVHRAVQVTLLGL